MAFNNYDLNKKQIQIQIQIKELTNSSNYVLDSTGTHYTIFYIVFNLPNCR
ncbi:hypothetical protein Hanom_Chr13g01217291 [Helianthus anomalus]